MRIGICEDIQGDANTLVEIIHAWAQSGDLAISAVTFHSAEEFLMSWESDAQFDLLFLDIRMGPMDGMSLAKLIRKKDSDVLIVFTTALREYSVDGYDVNALHFLVKPLDRRACCRVLKRAYAIIQERVSSFLIVSTDRSTSRLCCADIVFLESNAHYIVAHCRNKEILFRDRIGTLEQRLPAATFCRCHRTIIVNLAFVTQITKNRAWLADDRKTVVSVSETYWAKLNRAYMDYYAKR